MSFKNFNCVTPHSFPDLYSYERREALSAKKVFTELMGSKCEDADLDNDPMTGEYGNHEEKVTLYKNGIPEIIGKKTVEKLFEGKNMAIYTKGCANRWRLKHRKQAATRNKELTGSGRKQHGTGEVVKNCFSWLPFKEM